MAYMYKCLYLTTSLRVSMCGGTKEIHDNMDMVHIAMYMNT